MKNVAIARKYSDETGSRLLAVLIGLLIDLGGSIFIGIIATVGYGLFLGIQGVPYDQAVMAVSQFHEHPIAMMVLYPVGFGLSILGGYACARIVNANEYLCALIQACCSFAYGFSLGLSTESFLKSTILSSLSFGCVFLGAFIYVKMKNTHRSYDVGPIPEAVPPDPV